ncbi:MAG: ABC transporter ATP-binding protein [Nitrospirae bacterium]|nr:ABC transporter ATP-binding protein [Nitrospirota bacterium]
MTETGVPAIQIQDLSKQYRRYSMAGISTIKDLFVKGFLGRERVARDTFWALRNVTLAVPEGRTIGLIGPNGSGKSTLLKLITGILKPTAGSISVNGRISALIELGAGFHPEFTGRENVYLNGAMLGMSKAEISDRFDEIVGFAELEEFIDAPVKTYSSGMYMRLGFAVAVAVEPDVLLVDEILAVGDESFQHKCLRRINEIQNRGRTILFVSHDLSKVEKLCHMVAWLDHGTLRMAGEPQAVIDAYLADVDRADERALRAVNKATEHQRWGTREVEITGVRMLDARGEERAIFDSGEPVVIEIAYRADRRVEDPVFGIGLFRSDGLQCYGSNTDIDGVTLPYVEGEGTVRFVADGLDLLAGEYLLDCAVHRRDHHPYDYHVRLYRFAVRSEIKDSGVFRPAHRWEDRR